MKSVSPSEVICLERLGCPIAVYLLRCVSATALSVLFVLVAGRELIGAVGLD